MTTRCTGGVDRVLAFDQRSWHGATLLGSIRSVRATVAAQRVERRKTTWQQVLHALSEARGPLRPVLLDVERNRRHKLLMLPA